MKFLKSLSIFALSSFLTFSLSAAETFKVTEEKLGFLNSSWTNVIPGDVISQPAVTSYGFCVPTDGRMISAFSNDGVLLWEKSTSSSKNISIYALPDDFTLLWDSRKSTIKFLNPSGTEIWSKELSYSITKAPFPGRDGRFFLTGDNIIECYGINGICKWSLETKLQKNIPIQELPDGSIIVFLSENGGKTMALRVSPFGKAIEEITFAGVVKNAATTPEGVFLVFTNGAAGLFSISGDGLAKNKWGLEQRNANSLMITDNDIYLYLELFSNKIIVHHISLKDGSFTETFEIPNINGFDLQVSNFKDGNLFFGDSKNCCLYDTTGKKLWSALMPDKEGSTSWNSVIYTNDNHLVFFMDNWTISGYLTKQTLHHKKSSKKLSYKNYYNIQSYFPEYDFIDTLSRTIVSEKRYNELKSGNYGEKEIEYTSDIFSICSAYLTSLSKLNRGQAITTVFDKDPYGVESIFKQLALYGTSDAADYFGKLISATKDRSYLKVLLESISICGYDPNGKILQAIEGIFLHINHDDVSFLKTACDAVYSICVFMGRPAFYKRGKNLIKNLLQPQYDSSVQDYAKKTFEKILKLDF